MRGLVIKKVGFFCRGLCHLLAVSFLLIIINSCHHREDMGVPVPEGKGVFTRIAVVPFQQIAPDDVRGDAVRCPLCGMIFNASGSSGNPEKIIESLFIKKLDQKNRKFNVVAGDRVAGIYRRIATESLKAPLRQVVRDVGSELGVEGVIVGYVYRFRERKGASYSVEQPASVAFELHLVRVEDGAVVWRGHFDKTQSSLMENLLQLTSFYRERGRWVTAEELAEEGMEQVLKTFPGLSS